MKTIDRLKNYFFDKDYFISIYKNHIYIINYLEVLDFNNNKIKIRFEKFILLINGIDFKITRKNKYEIELKGNISKLEIIND